MISVVCYSYNYRAWSLRSLRLQFKGMVYACHEEVSVYIQFNGLGATSSYMANSTRSMDRCSLLLHVHYAVTLTLYRAYRKST